VPPTLKDEEPDPPPDTEPDEAEPPPPPPQLASANVMADRRKNKAFPNAEGFIAIPSTR
jgi:hypothetical protein